MKKILRTTILLCFAGALQAMVGCSEGTSSNKEVIDLGKGVKLEMMVIPVGKFLMGSPKTERRRDPDEIQHEVTITKPFYIGKYEVTQEQWQAVMSQNLIDDDYYKGAKLPVTDVSWNDSQDFIKKLNAKTNGGYRLPTEAEWEYACRAGTTTAYSFGDMLTVNDANYYIDSGIGKLVAVGSYKANAFGLYDMHGNVSEWCEDWYGDYPEVAATDPKGPSWGETRVCRGGSFANNKFKACSSSRKKIRPSNKTKDSGNGFRLAKTL